MAKKKATAKKPKAAGPGERAMAKRYKVKKPYESGVRKLCTDAIAAKGNTLQEIAAAMQKKHGIGLPKVVGYVRWLTAKGFLTREDK